MTRKKSQSEKVSLGELGEVVLQRAGKGRAARDVKLSEIFNLLCKGGTKYIRREAPDIRPETIALARAWLIATKPELYKQKIAPKQTGDLRILIDECVSPRVIPMIRNGFGFATHCNFVGLNGKGKSGEGDAEVWAWALDNNIDAVITRDRAEQDDQKDLTLIAKRHALDILVRMLAPGGKKIDINTLPVLIQVQSLRGDYQYVSGLMNRHRKGIQDLLHTRIAPVITVSEKGVQPETTYLKLWEQALTVVEPGPGMAKVTKQMKWASSWLKSILAANPAINDDHKEAITKILNNAAQRPRLP